VDAVADEVLAWQRRPLEPIYPVIYLDGGCQVFCVSRDVDLGLGLVS
jgi:hypothetical protein